MPITQQRLTNLVKALETSASIHKELCAAIANEFTKLNAQGQDAEAAANAMALHASRLIVPASVEVLTAVERHNIKRTQNRNERYALKQIR